MTDATPAPGTVVGKRTLRRLLEYRAATTPDRPFVIFDDLAGGISRLTYAEFDTQANRAAHALHALGIGRGDRVNLHLDNCIEFLALWFGAAKLGAVMMPTNTLASIDELAYLIDHSQARVIVTHPGHLGTAAELRRRCPSVAHVLACGPDAARADAPDLAGLLAAQPSGPPPVTVGPSDDVAIMYTSGTTARPKGVRVTNANYIYAGETVARAIRLGPDDRHYVVLPLFHANAQYYSTLSALVTGASLAVMARFSASRYFERCIAHGCTVASLFAAPIRMILAQEHRPEHRENQLRVVLTAQNNTVAQLAEWAERFGAPLLQLYGMTETMGPPLMNPLDDQRDNQSIGMPALGYEIRLVDEHGADVEPGQVGQILVRGIPGWSITPGYYRNPEATAATIRDGWLWTGDNAYQDANGYYHFVDRAKDMIKRAGENVAASEVEAVLLQHPAVFDCAVIGVPDPLRDEAIKAFVVLRPGTTADVDELIAWCRERLARFRVPEQIEFRSELPRTAVGKIQKHILRQQGTP